MDADTLAALPAHTQVEWVSARVDALHERLAVMYALRRGAMLAMRAEGHSHREIARHARLARSNVGRILSGGEPNAWGATVDRLEVAERLLARMLELHGLPAGATVAEAGLAALLGEHRSEDPEPDARELHEP
jgi:hypothetical protein